jgi:hypothetical protein
MSLKLMSFSEDKMIDFPDSVFFLSQIDIKKQIFT